MKKLYLLPLIGLLLGMGFVKAQPAIYSESNITQTSANTFETWKCAQGVTKIWTDSIYASYNWSTGDTTPMISLTSSGTVTLTAGGGTSTITVYQDQLANQNTLYVFPGNDACDGDIIELQTFVDPGNWVLWSWGDTVFYDSDCDTQYFPGCGMFRTASGNYSYVRYNSMSGCYYNSFNQYLNFYPEPTAAISQSNDTLYANAPGANTFQWFDGNQNAIPNATNNWYQPLAVGDYYVQASVNNGLVNCVGPMSSSFFWTSNCIANYYHFPDTTNQYSIIIVNTSVPVPGAGVSYLWDFGDGNSSTQAFPQHQYSGPGTYTVCVTVSDASCSHTYCDTLSVTNKRNTPFSINVVDPGALNAAEPDAAALNLTLWPQPAEEVLGLRFDLQELSRVRLVLFDMHGRLVKEMAAVDLAAGEQRMELDCAGLAVGMYLARLQVGERSHLRKVSIGR